MSGNEFRSIVFNLENMALGYLGENQELNEETLAALIRSNGGSSVVQMSLIAALTSDDADYKLAIVENTKKHPGGVPKLKTALAQIGRAHAVRDYIEHAEAQGGGTESAVAAACAHFCLSRSTIFNYLRQSRLSEPSLGGEVQ